MFILLALMLSLVLQQETISLSQHCIPLTTPNYMLSFWHFAVMKFHLCIDIKTIQWISCLFFRKLV